ncbi:MAG: tRNA (guanine(10)-N(2))-dimethyltransferase [Candidatus Lokiarchaeota archaeon]|nr:tRNA (guanine(10)-N(2))-dimethyltransferase [Candidatus Lokiarchaeota archaeon]
MERFVTEMQKKFTFPIKLWKEGKVSFFAPDQSIYERKDYPPSKFPVFYNPMMIINRDITLLIIKSYQEEFLDKKIKFGEPLCGIGIRGLRIIKEIGDINVYLNDINEISINLLKENMKFNNVNEDELKISINDANQFMSNYSKPKERFDILDIDPFGSPVKFVDSALQALKGENGLLCVTATDMPPLVGIYKKACFRKYGIYPIKTEYSHELALRILITFLIREAAKYDINLKILFSYYHQHHIRVFVKSSMGKLKVNESFKYFGYLYHCFNCNERFLSNLKDTKLSICTSCHSELEIIGPIWIGKLADKEFLMKMMAFIDNFNFISDKKIRNLITLHLSEIDSQITFHDTSRLIYEHKLKSIKLSRIIDGLKNKGFNASRTHFSPIGIKTNAKRNEIAEIIKNLL